MNILPENYHLAQKLLVKIISLFAGKYHKNVTETVMYLGIRDF